MKLVRVTEQARFYELNPSELQMLLIVIGSFPTMNRQQAISKSADVGELGDAQRMLDEAMVERRAAMRQELETWMKAPERFRHREASLEWLVENERHEWLLQIFNDVRVGSWVELGSPEDLELAHQRLGEASGQQIALMELAGMFQMALLRQTED